MQPMTMFYGAAIVRKQKTSKALKFLRRRPKIAMLLGAALAFGTYLAQDYWVDREKDSADAAAANLYAFQLSSLISVTDEHVQALRREIQSGRDDPEFSHIFVLDGKRRLASSTMPGSASRAGQSEDYDRLNLIRDDVAEYERKLDAAKHEMALLEIFSKAYYNLLANQKDAIDREFSSLCAEYPEMKDASQIRKSGHGKDALATRIEKLTDKLSRATDDLVKGMSHDLHEEKNSEQKHFEIASFVAPFAYLVALGFTLMGSIWDIKGLGGEAK